MANEENQKIKNSIKNTFDSVANSYDKNKQFIISAKKMVELIDLKGKNNLNILDLSTGTGSIAIELAKKFPKANIYGVDISNEMLNMARQKTQIENIKNITFLMQDVENLEFENLEFENIEFDIITCGYGLFFYPDMDRVFCNICTKLKSGGKFIFSTFTNSAFEPYSSLFLNILEENYNIKLPSRIEKRQLKTEDEIKEFTSQVEYKNLNIEYTDIRFPMQIDEWWQLLNTTGYKSLLTQLENNYSKFENEYINHLKSISKDDNINFNADSFITIVSL